MKVEVLVTQPYLILWDPMDYSLCPWNSPGKNTGVSCHFPSPGDLPDPGIEPGSPALQAGSLLAELQGKPKNIGGKTNKQTKTNKKNIGGSRRILGLGWVLFPPPGESS